MRRILFLSFLLLLLFRPLSLSAQDSTVSTPETKSITKENNSFEPVQQGKKAGEKPPENDRKSQSAGTPKLARLASNVSPAAPK